MARHGNWTGPLPQCPRSDTGRDVVVLRAMSNSPEPQPQRKWIVSKTGLFWQELVVPKACVICGETRTYSETFQAIVGAYTLRYFACLHPQNTKARSPSESPASR